MRSARPNTSRSTVISSSSSTCHKARPGKKQRQGPVHGGRRRGKEGGESGGRGIRGCRSGRTPMVGVILVAESGNGSGGTEQRSSQN